MRPITRRRFGGLSGGMLASLAFGDGCRDTEGALRADGQLRARPRVDVVPSAVGGRLGLERQRDALLQLPAAAGSPPPLLVLLHGAGGSGEGILRRVGPAAEQAGIAVLAPDSRGTTWDAVRDGFGPDVDYLDRALDHVFQTVSIDPARIALGGFSDGASYALSLGLINGDLFPRIVAFSPGFIVDGPTHGKPHIFVSHGTADQILPIERCSRVIVPALTRRGYTVTFREFDGRHEVPGAIAGEAIAWIAQPR